MSPVPSAGHSAWQLPDHLADVLPNQARQVESLRRHWLDQASRWGYELVIPPLLDHLESLLSGTGQALAAQTFQLVDQLSGCILGLRADTTTQAARIDAHLLGHQEGITRLCYCGPILHTHAQLPHASREPLQFGAEIYGSNNALADLEILLLALECLQSAGLQNLHLNLANTRLVHSLLHFDKEGKNLTTTPLPLLTPLAEKAIYEALNRKDAAALKEFTTPLPQANQEILQALLGLYGDACVLEEAQHLLRAFSKNSTGSADSAYFAKAHANLTAFPQAQTALEDLCTLAKHLSKVLPTQQLGFDLADLGGYGYYNGVRFAVHMLAPTNTHHMAQAPMAVLRGGRYDGGGAAFGRQRAAVGFSLDIKTLAGLLPPSPRPLAIRAPWKTPPDPVLEESITQLRAQGHIVIRCPPEALDNPMDAQAPSSFTPSGKLVYAQEQWLVQAMPNS